MGSRMTSVATRGGASKFAIAATLLFMPAAASAQTAPVSAEPPTNAGNAAQGDTSQDQTAAEAQGATNQGVADIVVTAQRREENLQRTALAVSAVSGEALVKANVTDVTQLTKLVPSLIVQPATGTSVGFFLRGVGSLVGNAFTENPVAFNFNQIYIARPAALLGTFYDLQRVEVLKGPQGTLYGRNATGGAINVIPNRPRLDKTSLDLTIEAGNYEAVRTQAAVNLPLGNTLALRVAGQIVSRRGFYSNDYDDEKGQAVRASLLFEPSTSFSAVVTADYFHQGGQGTGGVLVPGPQIPGAPSIDDRVEGSDPRSIAALRARFPFLLNPGLIVPPQTNGFVNSNFYGVSADIEADLGFAKLTVIPAFRQSKPNTLNYNGGYYGRVIENAKQTSLEVRLASPGQGPFNYVVGGYYFYEDQRAVNNFAPGPITNTFFDAKLKDRTYAIFGQATFAIVPKFRVVGGARYTWETKDDNTALTQTSFGVGPTSNISGTAKFRKFTYKAGVEWDVGPRNLLYANTSTGFKSGGFFIAALDNTFRPENIKAYTIGSKNRFFDNKLQINLEGFYWDYSDQQVNYIGPGRTSETTIGTVLRTANAGKSRIYGAEVELNFQPTRNDAFGLNVQYLNGKYNSFIYVLATPNGQPPISGCVVTPSGAFPTLPAPAAAFQVDCSGKPQINSPKFIADVSYEHTFNLTEEFNLVAGARSRLQSSRFLSPEYRPEEVQGSFMKSDAFVSLANVPARWSITGFINNIENKTTLAGLGPAPVTAAIYAVLSPPRTYGLRGTFSF